MYTTKISRDDDKHIVYFLKADSDVSAASEKTGYVTDSPRFAKDGRDGRQQLFHRRRHCLETRLMTVSREV